MGNNNSTTISQEEKNDIMDKYGVPKEKLNDAIERFNRVADEKGRITKKKFIEVRMDFSTPEVSAQLFDACDTDHSGAIDVREFLMANAVTLGTNIEEKLRASFTLYDVNGDNVLTREEVINTLSMFALQQYKKDHKIPLYRRIETSEDQKKKLKKLVDEVFRKCDKDKNGTLDMEEFVKGFSENQEVCKLLIQY